MAESRNKVRGIGLPFDPQYSSCSNIKPKDFDWVTSMGDWVVHIDECLLMQPDSTPKEKRFGWVCESKYIVPNVYTFLTHKHKEMFEEYYTNIFTCDQELLNLDERFVYCPNGSNYPWVPKEKWEVYNKTKLCSMFCSPKLMTEGHVHRHQIARLALDANISVFGGVHGTQRTVTDPHNPWNTKIDGLKDYMFSIIMENGVYDSYWTEKVTDCFATGTIPIYWGSKKLLDFFESDGIIMLQSGKEQEIMESLTPELYEKMKPSVENNFTKVKGMQMADDVLFERMQCSH